MLIGEREQKTNLRFKNVGDFETYISAIDNRRYDSDDVNFTGWLNKVNTPEYKSVNRPQYGRGTDFKQNNVDYIGNNCYIPTRGNCFIKNFTFLTVKVYTEEFLTFIRTEQTRSNVMTSARIQPFCRKYSINIGYYDGYRVCPGNTTETKIASEKQKNHFCLNWKSTGIRFNQGIDELKTNFKVIDSVISDKHFESFFYEYKPKEVQSQPTNMIVYDLESFTTEEAVSYANYSYSFGKMSGKCNRDITPSEYEKCRKDCFVFKGTNSINDMLYHVLQFYGEAK